MVSAFAAISSLDFPGSALRLSEAAFLFSVAAAALLPSVWDAVVGPCLAVPLGCAWLRFVGGLGFLEFRVSVSKAF